MVEPKETGGGILADEMGMGKTLSVLALVLRTLNTAHDWAIRVDDLNNATSEIPKKRRRSGATLIVASSDQRLMEADLVITTYHTLASDFARTKHELRHIEWYRLVIDEGDLSNFRKTIAIPFDEGGKRRTIAIERFTRLLDSMCLRRTKDVLHLPAEQHRVREVPFSTEERLQYEQTKEIMFRAVRNQNGTFDQKSTLGMFQRIDGECSTTKRERILHQFTEDPNLRVLIMTTGTGAVGLNLATANRVFIVEPQWNPSVENQAVARALRLGQKQAVLVTRYVVEQTVEQDMRALQDTKLERANLIQSG
ncbi:hypothetical protein J4E80_009173 [Alternaria sp. BMP 0032]|nr:hypothetical protein J4E80_009173 [Alternaria sp. BMP 0032]